jgi:hypothetical protein
MMRVEDMHRSSLCAPVLLNKKEDDFTHVGLLKPIDILRYQDVRGCPVEWYSLELLTNHEPDL